MSPCGRLPSVHIASCIQMSHLLDGEMEREALGMNLVGIGDTEQ